MDLGRRAVALFLLTSVSVAPARAEAPRERWVSEWGDGVCRLVRTRGDPPAPYLMFEIVPGSGSLELWLINPELSLRRERTENVSIRLEPSGAEVGAFIERYLYRGDRYYAAHGLPEASLETLPSTAVIRLERSGQRLLDVPLPDMRRAVPVLRDCIRDQLRVWGFDPAMYDALQRPPRSIGNLASWVTSGDYPAAALRAGVTGRSVARVTIGVDGRARACTTIMTSGDRSLDQKTCDISERGRFEPAIDAAGRPTEMPLVYSIRWMIR